MDLIKKFFCKLTIGNKLDLLKTILKFLSNFTVLPNFEDFTSTKMQKFFLSDIYYGITKNIIVE